MYKTEYHPSRFFHWSEIKVRFRDIDALNHVNNSVFNTYFEEARIQFISDIPEFMNSMKEGHSFVLVRIQVDYISPIVFTETVLIGTSVEEYGNTSIKGIQAIYSSETKELKAVAKTTGVWFDLALQRPVKLPEIPNRNQYLFKNEVNG
jgi:acyl-CoA thioester hydrolase